MKKDLAKQGRIEDAVTFSELYSKLKTFDGTSSRNWWPPLYLFYALSEDPKVVKNQSSYFGDVSSLNNPYLPKSRRAANATADSSGIGTLSHASDGNLTTVNATSVDFAAVESAINHSTRGGGNKTSALQNLTNGVLTNRETPQNEEDGDIYPIESTLHADSRMLSKCFAANADGNLYAINDQLLLRDLLFVFQGIDGKIVRFDTKIDAYRIGLDINVPLPIRDMVSIVPIVSTIFSKCNI